MSLDKVVSLIPAFPLLGAVLSYLLGKINRSISGFVATLSALLSFIAVVFVTLHKENSVIQADLFQWIPIGKEYIDFSFRYDNLTAVMCLVITGIGTLIHLYSTAYMKEDEGRHRFFSYLNLFLFAMLILVLGSNLLVLFVGWEGVGLCSYLLIGFWFKNLNYASAGRKAFVVNRIGDAGFLLAVFIAIKIFGTTDFVKLQNMLNGFVGVETICTILALALFVGACGKSAQVPLFVWLPDAMAGPTPVSALIHAATMVTAGVYLLARMHFVFDLAPLAGAVVCLIAVITAFIAATIALTQNDIKKVLAYSTVSQLGFMFIAASVGAYWVAIFHVVTHAFFKACLFLGAGSVIHGCHHEQDMRHMGGLAKLMPITFVTYLISTLAIAGIFPFAGYYSKHAIISALEHSHNPYIGNILTYILLIVKITAALTAFYMTRSLMLTFMGTYKGHAHPHESPFPMTIPLIVLSILAMFGGIYLVEILPEYLSHVLGEIEAHAHESLVESILGSGVGIAGVFVGVLFYTVFRSLPALISKYMFVLTDLSKGKYYFDELYSSLIIRPLEEISFFLWKWIDACFIDGIVNGTGSIVEVAGETTRKTQTGQIRHYSAFILLAAIFFVIFYLVF